MQVINLFGAPCTGKSTMAAELFAKLKQQQVNCELVTEYAKDLVWDTNISQLDDQLLVFATQNHRLRRLRNKVDFAITDSPLLFSVIYDKDLMTTHFHQFVLDVFRSYNNRNFFLKLQPSHFNPTGRVHTITESWSLEKQIQSMLEQYNIAYTPVTSVTEILTQIQQKT